MHDHEAMTARWAADETSQRLANTSNTKSILDALAARGIELVVVAFDGCGDSGRIDSIIVSGKTNTLLGEVTVETGPYADPTLPQTKLLAQAVEDLCYEILAVEYYGWEDNDGASGEFVFDVAAQQIKLTHNARYTGEHTTAHTFPSEG